MTDFRELATGLQFPEGPVALADRSVLVVEIRRGPVPASAWQVPAGYTKVDNPMTKGGRSM